jgi:hypothetical protein
VVWHVQLGLLPEEFRVSRMACVAPPLVSEMVLKAFDMGSQLRGSNWLQPLRSSRIRAHTDLQYRHNAHRSPSCKYLHLLNST